MLHPPHSRVGRGNLVLKHSVPHFLLNFSKHCVLSGRTQRRAFALLPEWKNEKILINNHSFLRVRIEPTTVALQSHPCASRPRGRHIILSIIYLLTSFLMTSCLLLSIKKVAFTTKSSTMLQNNNITTYWLIRIFFSLSWYPG